MQTNLPYNTDESRGSNFILPCSLRHSVNIFVTWQNSSKNISEFFLNIILYILQGVRFFRINRMQWLGLIVSLKTIDPAILCALTAKQTLFLMPCKGTSTVWGVAGTPLCVILTHQVKTRLRSRHLSATDSSNNLQYWLCAFQCGTNFVWQ